MLSWLRFVACVVVAVGSSGASASGSSWTPAQLEQRVNDELLAEGTPPSALGLKLWVAPAQPTGWSVTLQAVEGAGPARARALAELPSDSEAAAAEIAVVARELMRAPPTLERALLTPTVAPPGVPDAEVVLDARVQEKLKIIGALGAGSPGSILRWDALGTVLALLTASEVVSSPFLTTQGSILTRGLGVAGGVAILGSLIWGLSLGPEAPQLWAPLTVAMAGAAIAIWGNTYSPQNALAAPAGFRPAYIVAGSVVALDGLLAALLLRGHPGCSSALQREVVEGVDAAPPAAQTERIRNLESCAVAEQDFQRRLYWIELPFWLANIAGLVLAVVEAVRNSPLIANVQSALLVAPGTYFPFLLARSGPMERYLDAIHAENLPLEVSIGPASSGAGLAVHGRF